MKGYAAIGLDNPKDKQNIGSALRAVGCYNASLLVVSGTRYGGSLTDTMKIHKQIPLLQVDDLKLAIPYDCVPVAVDLVEDAQSLVDYIHPKRAFYIFGAEDATLGARTLSFCRDKIYIPTNRCMNLAATVNVVLYDRMMKEILKSKK
jgi:tRNA(Leu) C34 or U34 (ribose-2'-O)-methylase TrmL